VDEPEDQSIIEDEIPTTKPATFEENPLAYPDTVIKHDQAAQLQLGSSQYRD
jgi:hypothetical protein